MAYLQYFGWMDGIIWLLGGLVFLLQVGAILLLHFGFVSTAKPRQVEYLQPWYHFIGRVSAVAVDALPLLGLLGTVFALLKTFTGMTGSGFSSEVVANFAPGLTTTISGLLTAFLNLIWLQLVYSPTVKRLFG